MERSSSQYHLLFKLLPVKMWAWFLRRGQASGSKHAMDHDINMINNGKTAPLQDTVCYPSERVSVWGSSSSCPTVLESAIGLH